MELLTQLLQALWAQDFETPANPSMIGMLYFVLFVILFLETACFQRPFTGRQFTGIGRRVDCERRDGLPANDSAADRCRQPRLLGQLYSGGDGWAIPAPYKTGYLIYPRIIINAHTIFLINTVYRRC